MSTKKFRGEDSPKLQLLKELKRISIKKVKKKKSSAVERIDKNRAVLVEAVATNHPLLLNNNFPVLAQLIGLTGLSLGCWSFELI